ncbi:MAG: S8 family serine peptidase [Bdellovibrionia bacterium]
MKNLTSILGVVSFSLLLSPAPASAMFSAMCKPIHQLAWKQSGILATRHVIPYFRNTLGSQGQQVRTICRFPYKNAQAFSAENVKGSWSLTYAKAFFAAKDVRSRWKYLNTLFEGEFNKPLPLEEIYDFSNMTAEQKSELGRISESSDRILVGVIDRGINLNHPELAYKIPRNPNNPGLFPDDQPIEYCGHERFHGTAVAGVILEGSDDIAIIPIQPKEIWGSTPKDDREVQLLFVQAVAKGVEEAHQLGARIINMSGRLSTKFQIRDLDLNSLLSIHWTLSNFFNHPKMLAGFARIISDYPDTLFIFSAGNEGANNDEGTLMGLGGIPQSLQLPNMLIVTSNREHSPDSSYRNTRWNYGKETTHLSANGNFYTNENLQVAPDFNPADTEAEIKSYLVLTGTSFAAPRVTRTCAKMKAINPALTPAQMIEILKKTVVKYPDLEGELKWGGELNEAAALEMAKANLLNTTESQSASY